ncbi:MAG: type I methionyl aminopeptidase [Eubacteriaceae bacterium]|nr:type I methionyl aminopeptidase [Eubacteriaceae bacterium]MBQ1466064.1 type I methionyl aminopeptidase [Eubacteriaceae bacterium]MBR2780627.1 type I methionyl aminopeptidase [Eubacteriaceae bacterium]MCR4894536.1 type I methionyl aminopeptidase [Eubacteriales bacterium]
MITIKSAEEIELMAEAGRITALALREVEKAVRAGISTKELDEIAYEAITSMGAKPAFLGYNGFKGSICASPNDVIVHGIPSRKVILREGDIISVDIGAVYKGFVGDMARTFPVGKISDEAAKLIEVTRQSFFEGIEFCRDGNRLNDISKAVGDYAESFGYGVVRDYVGHGIGRKMHEEPSVPNYDTGRPGIRLRKGMVLAIEPMINIGTWDTVLADDGWKVSTADGTLSAHYENTVAITSDGPRILTRAD